MPLTFLSHQAVVLPLKLRGPRRVNGTALTLGSMSPDVEYYVRGMPAGALLGHTWLGQLTLCLPTTLVLFWLVTRVIAEPLAANLPDGGDFRLRDYALLRDQPSTARHWGVVALSALVGSLSHVVLDRATGGWSSGEYLQRRSWIPADLLPSDAAWAAIQLAVWAILAVATMLMLRHIGRHRLLRRWAEERGTATVHASGARWPPFAFWTPIALVAVAATVWGAAFPRRDYHLNEFSTWVHIGLRTISCTFVALVLVCGAWNLRARQQTPTLRSPQ